MSARSGLFGLLVQDETTRRAFEEAIADWREEWIRAHSPFARIAIAARGWLSLARVVGATMRVGFMSRSTWSVLTGTLLTSAALSLLLIDSVWSNTGWPLLSFSNIALAVLMLIPQGQAVLMAPVAAIGLGLRPRQPLSPLAIVPALMLAMVVLVGWLLPASNQMYREYLFSMLGESGTLAMGLPELNLPDLIRKAANGSLFESSAAVAHLISRIGLVVAVPIYFVFGIAMRSLLANRTRWGIVRFAAGATAAATFMLSSAVVSAIRGMLPDLLRWESGGLTVWLSSAILCLATIVMASTRRGEPAP